MRARLGLQAGVHLALHHFNGRLRSASSRSLRLLAVVLASHRACCLQRKHFSVSFRLIMGKTKEQYIAEYVAGVASIGGKARAKALTARRRQAIAKAGAAARWGKAKKTGT
jgi:hypothetical protein